MEFVVLNHDEDLLALLDMEWLVQATQPRKNGEAKSALKDRRLGGLVAKMESPLAAPVGRSVAR